jgi:predicted homoserine dehydrogenase-like protein
MAQGSNQIVNSVPGMSMVAVYSRKPQKAIHSELFRPGKSDQAVTQTQLDDAIVMGSSLYPGCYVDRAQTCGSNSRHDQLYRVQRTRLARAFNGKDVVLLNAEPDATIGPILQIR